MKWSTKFTVDLEKSDDSLSVTGLVLTYGSLTGWLDEFSDGSTLEINGSSNGAEFITNIAYYVSGSLVSISKATYNDYFVYGDTYLKVYKAD